MVPLKRLDKVSRNALRFALTISTEITAVQLLAGEPDERDLTDEWAALVEEPCRRAGVDAPNLVTLRSGFREMVEPLLRDVQRLTLVHPDRSIVVVVPELVERRWYHLLLRNHVATALTARLLLEGGQRVIVANAPWYARERPAPRRGRNGPSERAR